MTEEYNRAVVGNRDSWVPACGGTETPFTSRSGRVLLYCYNPYQHKHAYYDCSTDIILSDNEANACLQNGLYVPQPLRA